MSALAGHAMLAACRLILRLRRLNSDVLLAVLVSAHLILLKLHTRNLLLILLHAVRWEVLGTSLISKVVDLRDLFANTVRLIHICSHVPVAIIVLHVRLSC